MSAKKKETIKEIVNLFFVKIESLIKKLLTNIGFQTSRVNTCTVSLLCVLYKNITKKLSLRKT